MECAVSTLSMTNAEGVGTTATHLGWLVEKMLNLMGMVLGVGGASRSKMGPAGQQKGL